MRIAIAFWLLAVALLSPVHARDAKIKFDGVQENCVQAGQIKFGAHAKWSNCSVTMGRWFATLDFIDMYQAQYCLGNSAGACDQRALLVFGNRAYTPNAKLILQRIDRAGAEYDEPQLLQTKYGDVLTLAARFPDGSVSKSYYRWSSGQWKPVEARGWLRDLARQLPKDKLVTAEIWPDVDSMSAHAMLQATASSGASDRAAEVELGLANDRFTVRKVSLVQKAD